MSDAQHDSAPKQPAAPSFSILRVLIVAGIVGILIILLLPAIDGPHQSSPRGQCSNNLRQIGLALQSYHAALGCFPPAYIVDANGRPMHSWRALILPYLEQQSIQKMYDFNQPWDSPHNMALLDKMPSVYRCPSAENLPPGHTSYVAIVGPRTLFSGANVRTEKEVRDGLSNTIMVIERDGPSVSWLEPLDTTAEEVRAPLERKKLRPTAEERTSCLPMRVYTLFRTTNYNRPHWTRWRLSPDKRWLSSIEYANRVTGENLWTLRDAPEAAMSHTEHDEKSTRRTSPLVMGILVGLVGLVILLGTLVVLLLPPMVIVGHGSPCSNNLRQIGLALQSYHIVQGCFPPAYTVDANGRPMHSWRALILPYLDDESFAKQYDYAQPWDSPHNLALGDKMPSVFRCTLAPGDQPPGLTNYVAVVGPDTLFPGSVSRSEKDVVDGLSQTIMAIEVGRPWVNWLEPVDLTADELRSNPRMALRSPHDDRISVLFADASVRFLRSKRMQLPSIDALLSINGHDSVKVER